MIIYSYIALATAASAATTDLRDHRIPNALVFPVLVVALLGHFVFEGLDGLLFSFAGFAVGLLIFFLPFVIRMMGAGDVKLMAAIGALMGWRFILVTAVYASIAGLFVGLAILAKHKGWLLGLVKYLPQKLASYLIPKLGPQVRTSDSASVNSGNSYNGEDATQAEAGGTVKADRIMVPYGYCIAIGVFLVLVGETLGNWPLINFIR